VAIGLVGMGMERFFLRRLQGQVLGQVLMTIGFALIFQDLALLIWGGGPGRCRTAAGANPAERVHVDQWRERGAHDRRDVHR
jgi:branched-chain amino acid transport system permease protein